MKNEKIWKKIFWIFFIQDIAWDIQKCILEVFLKNLYILWNAPHIRLGTFWGHKPFWIIGNRFLTKSTYIKWYLVVKIKNSKVYPWGTIWMKKATYFYGIWCQNGIPFLAPYSAKTEPVLAPYSAKTELRFWHHMVPHGASWCQKVPKRGTQYSSTPNWKRTPFKAGT